MRTALIVIDSPLPDHGSCMTQGMEPMFVQAFVPEFPIDALDKGILGRFSGLDQLELNTVLIGPLIKGFSCEFRPLISTDGLGITAKAGRLIQNAGDIVTGNTEIHR